MTDGATGLRERKKAETAFGLTRIARRLVAERGMAAVTVEELCEEIGVSRRTFFNYFASKEDAILGIPAKPDPADAAANERFVGRGARPDGGALSADLLDDLADLAVHRMERLDITSADVGDVLAVFKREPRLFSHVMERSRDQERGDVALVERREGLPAGDLRAVMAVHLINAIVRNSAEEFVASADTASFRDLFERRIAAARAVFAA